MLEYYRSWPSERNQKWMPPPVSTAELILGTSQVGPTPRYYSSVSDVVELDYTISNIANIALFDVVLNIQTPYAIVPFNIGLLSANKSAHQSVNYLVTSNDLLLPSL